MFKNGDKIVFIGDNNYKKYGIYYGKTYIIEHIYMDYYIKCNFFRLYGIGCISINEKNMHNFITVRDYRKLKIENINKKVH